MNRSRSSSRNRSPQRRHRKRKHKSRRSRSRSRSGSRSRSYERSGSNHRIHFNPAFGAAPFQQAPPQQPQMGYSAMQLLQNNNALEAEVQRLKAALLAEQGTTQIEMQRNRMLANEMRNIGGQRDDYAKRYGELMNDRRHLIDSRTEMSNRLSGLDVANRQLREEVVSMQRQVDAKNEEIGGLLYQADIVQQQIKGLDERNATLKNKCESMVASNRRLLEEINEKKVIEERTRLSAQKTETDLKLANEEIKRLLKALENSRPVESLVDSDRNALEIKLAKKDDEMRLTNFKSAAELKVAHEKIEKLERKLKNEKPAKHNDISVESIYLAIETMKSTYERQLKRLEEEVGSLRTCKLRDHGDEVESPESGEIIEELPEYLQTPRRPDPSINNKLLSTNQVRITMEPILERPLRPSSGPPVDFPVSWHLQKSSVVLETSSQLTVPLFGTANVKKEVTEKFEVLTSDELLEEELLAGSSDMISPIQNLDMIERQLLDEP